MAAEIPNQKALACTRRASMPQLVMGSVIPRVAARISKAEWHAQTQPSNQKIASRYTGAPR